MHSNIFLIIGHEYRTRVLKKSFILTTLLTPLFLLLVMIVPVWLMTSSEGDKEQKTICIIDNAGLYEQCFLQDSTYRYVFSSASVEDARKTYSDAAGILYISGNLREDTAYVCLYSDKQLSSETCSHLRHLLQKAVEQQKIDAYNIPNLKEIIRSVDTNIRIQTIVVTKEGEEKITSAEIYELLGMVLALLIYFISFTYGASIMQSVAQEKSNRIMEVMVASTRPFDLMMGKIISIALVGLTQLLIWGILLSVGAIIAMPFIGQNLNIDITQLNTADTMQQLSAQSADLANVVGALLSINYAQLALLFILYFIGGYMLYASIFAALGSAVDNETDTQQFSMPVSIIVIFAMYAGIYAAQHPETDFSFWCSMIPFTSPIVMLVRIPYGVATWEIVLSIAILYLTFVLTTWLAAKIYRIGILMYGKKATWKDLWRWLKE